MLVERRLFLSFVLGPAYAAVRLPTSGLTALHTRCKNLRHGAGWGSPHRLLASGVRR